MNKNKRNSLNRYSLLGLLVAAYCIYYLLLRDNNLPFSIRSVLSGVNGYINHWPVLIVGLLPVYVALMIFGIAVLGLYLGSLLERFVTRYFKKNSS